MTENTPTPAELIAEARSLTSSNWGTEGAIVDRLIDAFEAVTAERDAASRDATELARELAALSEIPEEDLLDVTTERDALRRERDALAAIRAEVLAWAVEHGAPGAYPSEPFTFDKGVSAAATDVHGILSKLPADALADVNAAAGAAALRAFADVLDRGRPAAFPENRPTRMAREAADRIEREAQR